MADDITQDQTQTTPEQPPTNPVDTSTNQTQPKPETTTQNPSPSETPQPEQIPTETQPSVFPPVLNIPVLHYPFSGNFPLTFSFGQQSDNEEIKKKFQEWGIVGHNGLDFGLTAGNEVFACDSGKVIQSGDNGDFGISITIQHSWGQSIYAHLQETKVKAEMTEAEYPQYTRPENYKGMKVPKVLLSGNHKKITEWRTAEAIKIQKKTKKANK